MGHTAPCRRSVISRRSPNSNLEHWLEPVDFDVGSPIESHRISFPGLHSLSPRYVNCKSANQLTSCDGLRKEALRLHIRTPRESIGYSEG